MIALVCFHKIAGIAGVVHRGPIDRNDYKEGTKTNKSVTAKLEKLKQEADPIHLRYGSDVVPGQR